MSRTGAKRMSELIDDLLALSRIGRADLRREAIDLSEMVGQICEEIRQSEPERNVTFAVAPNLGAQADGGLMRVVFDNLIGNAWKFTGKVERAHIEVGVETHGDVAVFFVRDNGAGFDMAYADTLFAPFRRLHREKDFPGTGIGLATVYRVIDRHGGRVWAEGAVGRGATVFFTVPPPRG
jgi:signal transduction histidine kinase